MMNTEMHLPDLFVQRFSQGDFLSVESSANVIRVAQISVIPVAFQDPNYKIRILKGDGYTLLF